MDDHRDQQQAILNSWKEIAQYVGRGVRTVQRWEAELGLPVRRPRGKRRSAVMAVAGELDHWMAHRPLHILNSVNSDGRTENCMTVLVIEDNITDLNSCVNVIRKIPGVQLDTISSIPTAMVRLENIRTGELPKPELIIFDLNFSVDSGFEVLRYLRTHTPMRDIPVIVWTILAATQQELCDIFGVHRVVQKLAGPGELHRAILSARSRPLA